ncbi:MAG TPA: cysteine synthase family protein [Polyangiaceae bacterium LLY-WYZ-15_(1-7)]|nr:cysteine synthase family protein [Polyangiaceae bacterium LLY-WYZ-15_(1-7)]HJL05014.1 cysteine synthase family protein [Polyangiaceae bacterium LLY-WYZ-15_(1-7)]HJL10369.1 cysteine synthase family protein [Polyangiaceae bacterium LLY-WYZ-15_(1-7)]HJL29182.1 cysteine synthase family protein [Polyangiaceae bacterium LLY-WYZ-15_(1-7)]HJL37794.1 cysteine synthase family protein [Polyangiaceae bacterium LLY-WYZ-15_(1-7)]
MARLDMKAWLSRVAGSTATVPIPDEESGCTIWVKLEYLLPSGSTKDRVAAFVLGHAIERGDVTEDTIVVEASSGSTSIALAMASALLGVRFVAVMPEGVSAERVWIIRRYGGEVVLTPKEKGILGAIEKTKAMAAEDPNVFLPRQFENPLNALAHQRITGPELITQVGRSIHGFVAGVGTGGTLMGVARALDEMGHRARIGRVRPTTGVCFQGMPEVCGGIPGVVDGMSAILDEDRIDREIEVPDCEAVHAARELIARGFPVGPSSGLNFAAARRLAAELGPGHDVATVLCDRMERYFSTDLFQDLK